MITRINTFEELESVGRTLPPVVVAVVGAADRDVFKGTLRAVQAGVARALLVGNRGQLTALQAEVGATSEGIEIVHAADDADAVSKAVALAASGTAGVLLKGMVSTGLLLRTALSQSSGLKEGDTLLSDVLVCPNPFLAERPLWGITDGGVNVAPGMDQKRKILKNGLAVLRAMGYSKPRVAILCASEKPDRAMPATLDAKQLAEEAAEGAFGSCLVEGPLALDVAISAEAARHKGVSSQLAGAPDLLLTPSVEAGNLLGKALYLTGQLPVAHVIAGMRVPILINSRNDSAEDRYRSILLAMVVAARWKQPNQGTT